MNRVEQLGVIQNSSRWTEFCLLFLFLYYEDLLCVFPCDMHDTVFWNNIMVSKLEEIFTGFNGN